MAGEGRDIFPLPLLVLQEIPSSFSVSRSVQRRLQRRLHVQKYVNKAVTGLNSMYFGGLRGHGVPPIVNLQQLSHSGKRGVLRHLISRVQAAGCPPTNLKYSGAIHALRVASSPYGDVMTGVGDVVPWT